MPQHRAQHTAFLWFQTLDFAGNGGQFIAGVLGSHFWQREILRLHVPLDVLNCEPVPSAWDHALLKIVLPQQKPCLETRAVPQ